MKVTLERTFPMPATPDVTWDALTDIAGVASCMPGAAISEKIDDQHAVRYAPDVILSGQQCRARAHAGGRSQSTPIPWYRCFLITCHFC